MEYDMVIFILTRIIIPLSLWSTLLTLVSPAHSITSNITVTNAKRPTKTTGRSPSSTILSAAVASANIKQRNVNVSYNSEKELLVWSSPTSYNNNITNLSENPVTFLIFSEGIIRDLTYHFCNHITSSFCVYQISCWTVDPSSFCFNVTIKRHNSTARLLLARKKHKLIEYRWELNIPIFA